jgi:hypothetical protein
MTKKQIPVQATEKSSTAFVLAPGESAVHSRKRAVRLHRARVVKD